MEDAPVISVIIPHYSDLHGLEICLAKLEAQTLPREDFEIIVADNASPEGPVAVERVIAGRARLVVVSERGAGLARNGAVAEARGQVLAFIDSDCVAEPQWLTEGLRGLDDYDFVGGRVRVLVEDLRRMTDAEAFERVFAFDFESYITRKGFTGSGNMFCPKAVFQTVGGFKAGVSEDVEWSHRARGMGFRLGYAPKAVVGHPARRTWPELREKWRRVNAETSGLMMRNGRWRLKWFVKSAALPLSALAHMPKVLLTEELATFGQRLAALRMLFRLRLWRMVDAMSLLSRSKGA